MSLDSRLATTALFLVPGALTVYLSFNGGGFFPNTVAFVAVLVAGALILRVGVAEAPFEGVSRLVLIAGGALLGFAGWTLLSAVWSDSESRALIEFDRVLLYVAGADPVRLGQAQPGQPAVAGARPRRGGGRGRDDRPHHAGAAEHLADLARTSPTTGSAIRSPTGTRWACSSGLGIVFCTYLTTSLQEPRVARVLAAAPIPALASTLLFTFSRGAIAATIVGVLAYVLVARPRGLVSGLLAVRAADRVRARERLRR